MAIVAPWSGCDIAGKVMSSNEKGVLHVVQTLVPSGLVVRQRGQTMADAGLYGDLPL
jgi:hypothetical protein